MKVSDGSDRVISDAQVSRLWAIAYEAAREYGYDNKQDVSDRVSAVLGLYGFDCAEDVTRDAYDEICERLEGWD